MDINPVETIKLNINEKYKSSKNSIKNNAMMQNITHKSIDKEYNNTISNIDKEYDNFKNNKSHYSIITNAETKKKKLIVELNKCANQFLIKLAPLNNNYSVIEQELTQFDENQKTEKIQEIITQKNIELFAAQPIFVTDSANVINAINGGYWF
jgi:hypothetical protein